MASDKYNINRTTTPNSRGIGKYIEDMNFQAIMRRRPWERRWYNNRWFDDGYHFRLVGKKTGIVIDHLNVTEGFIERAIPRASKQIRGIGALLLTPDYNPIVLPKRTTMEDFRNKTTKQVDQYAYQEAIKTAKENARRCGIYLTTTWEDKLELGIKLATMALMTAKDGISYIKIYTDPQTKEITASIHDAFDVICYGDVYEIDDLPFMTLTKPMDFNEVLADPMFEEEFKQELSPDNLYATSEIKEAYMRSRYGSKLNAYGLNSIIVRESFIKEYLSDDNWERAKKLGEDTGAMEGKSKGDLIMRHPFSAGGVTLKDEYIDYNYYPFADLRFEPGLIYQVPLIERFIPLNKTQDIVVTRIEKWINTMVTGIYMQRKGENMQIANLPGGQRLQFEGTEPKQMAISNVGPTPFQFMQMTDKYLEEQGISSTNVQELPNNVSNNTIENIQQHEYENMKFATMRLKSTVKRIGELVLERTAKDKIHPMEVTYKEGREYKSFDVIGSRGKKAHDKVNSKLPEDLLVIDDKYKIRIEADMGFGLTPDGRKQAVQTLLTELVNLYKLGFLSAAAMALAVKRFIEEYGFGSTEEFMEAIENGVSQGQMSQDQIKQIQIALLQVLKDTQAIGPQRDKALVDSTKLGVLQTLKDTGLVKQTEQEGKPEEVMKVLATIYTKPETPPDIKRQIEGLLGLTPSTEEPVTLSQAKTAKELHGITKESTGQTLGSGVTS